MLDVSAAGALDLAAGAIVNLSHRLHVAQGIIAADQQNSQHFHQDSIKALVLRLTALLVGHVILYRSKVSS